MRSTFQRRVARLESAVLQQRAFPSGPVNAKSFFYRVQIRMRLKKESFETAFQALVVHLEDDELQALIAQTQAALDPQEPSGNDDPSIEDWEVE